MCKITLRPIVTDEDKKIFTSEIQEAFQRAFIEEFGEFEEIILPTEDIEESFNTKGAEAYIAENNDGKRVGGTIIVIDDKTKPELFIMA